MRELQEFLNMPTFVLYVPGLITPINPIAKRRWKNIGSVEAKDSTVTLYGIDSAVTAVILLAPGEFVEKEGASLD